MSQGSAISFTFERIGSWRQLSRKPPPWSKPCVLAREDRREIEAETVDVHLGDPVAQRVGHHLQHARMAQVQRVAGAGIVDVVARLVAEAAGSTTRCRCL